VDPRSTDAGDSGDAGRRRPPSRPTGTFRIGQIGGVDVLVRSSWLLVAVLIAVTLAPAIDAVQPGLGGWKYVAGVAFAVLLYLSVLLHEASHALMAQRYGLPVSSITLHFLGGVTSIEGEPDTPRREFGVSVVGPLTSLGVGVVFLGLHFLVPHGLIGLAVDALAYTNLFVGVLNLVPGMPLDGGRVLRAAVWKLTGNPNRATAVSGWAGRCVAALVLASPVLLGITGFRVDATDVVLALVFGWFLWTAATSAIASARVRSRLPALRARALARRTVTLPEDLPLSEAVRQAQEAQAGSIVTLDREGVPVGVVNEAAVHATPEDRRPWMPVSSVSRRLAPGLRLPVGLEGEPLVRAMQTHPATEYLLVEEDGSVYGVLTTADVDAAFAASAR
jgi:Zn-dependent protease/CBS domain-containing protein